MLDKLIGPVSGLLDKFVEDKDEKNRLAHEIATMASKQSHEETISQLELAKAQASHSSIFVAGARPALLWVACLGLLTEFFILPLATWVAKLWMPEVEMVQLGTGELIALTTSILGLGSLRSFEKSKGISRENLK
tara:strand:- start:25 stop:429 length:405 start_codon:yes stop_codon:yes gene_type:complete